MPNHPIEKILLIDDANVLNETIRLFLLTQPEIELVGSTDDINEATEMLLESQPSLVLLGLRVNTFTDIGCIRNAAPLTPILMMGLLSNLRVDALSDEIDIDGYIDKNILATELLPTIKRLINCRVSKDNFDAENHSNTLH